MRDCKDCKGDCSPPPRWPTPKTEGKGPARKKEMSTYLKPEPKPELDSTSLDQQCTCPMPLNIPRYTCLPCIRSWVSAVPIKEVEEWIEKLRAEKRSIAVERLEMTLKERKLKELESERFR